MFKKCRTPYLPGNEVYRIPHMTSYIQHSTILLLRHILGPVYDGVSQFCFPFFLSSQYDACVRSVLPERRLVFPPVRVVSTDVSERRMVICYIASRPICVYQSCLHLCMPSQILSRRDVRAYIPTSSSLRTTWPNLQNPH